MPLESRDTQSAPGRDYAPIATSLRRDLPADAERQDRMQAVADALWNAFGLSAADTEALESHRPGEGRISWVGFYAPVPGKEEMILGPRRDKPACSPIGLHGACGRSYLSRKALVIGEVSRLGEGYIACDPRDRSEVVIPCFNPDGSCWGVLDADSYDANAFTERDAYALMLVLRAAGLSFSDAEVEVV